MSARKKKKNRLPCAYLEPQDANLIPWKRRTLVRHAGFKHQQGDRGLQGPLTELREEAP